jgi:hypothetical protein
MRKLTPVKSEEPRKCRGTLHGFPWRLTDGVEPDAVKVARPVLNGEDEETDHWSCALSLPNLAYITGTVDQELLLRNAYLITENRLLHSQIQGRVRLTDAERKTLAEIGKRLGELLKYYDCDAA